MSLRINDFKSNFVNGARPNMYRMSVGGLPSKLEYLCKSTSLPSKAVSMIEIPYLNMKYKVAGVNTFENLSMTIMMDTDMQVRTSIELWLEDMRTNDAMFGQTPAEYQKTAQIDLLDPNSGDPIAQYEYENIFPINLGAVELAFESGDSIAEFTCEFAYSHWIRLA